MGDYYNWQRGGVTQGASWDPMIKPKPKPSENQVSSGPRTLNPVPLNPLAPSPFTLIP